LKRNFEVVYLFRHGAMSRVQRIQACCDSLRHDIDGLNRQKTDALNDHIHTAVNNFIANVRWRFLNPDGPKIEKVTIKEPLMFRYGRKPPTKHLFNSHQKTT